MTIEVTPSGQVCGAAVRGVDLTSPLDAETVAEIRTAWLQHRVLSFPDQAITDADQERFTLYFGPFGDDPFFEPIDGSEHIAAIHSVRDIEQTFVAARDGAKGERLVEDMAKADPPIGDITICETADEAVARADIVCTVTTSADPVFSPGAIRPGTHINAVGSYQPHTAEIPAETVQAARVCPVALRVAGTSRAPAASMI